MVSQQTIKGARSYPGWDHIHDYALEAWERQTTPGGYHGIGFNAFVPPIKGFKFNLHPWWIEREADGTLTCYQD